MSHSNIRRALPDYRWEAVDLLAYKDAGSAPFKDVTRQLLFRTDALGCELRYFEVAAEGHSTLERHEHAHAVMILRGRGACLVGAEVRSVGPHDLVHIPPMTWHQFRANAAEPLGFLCMVNVDRDRPQLPAEPDLVQLRADPRIAAFIRT
ncbi:cupin domain-containing protein [Nitrogeniibacter mangrovi]|uniref:Cupin domain-containing protein n=1 Tax=Nitrogeniibacter mangrovi TaxID=2016596 RepID=A0A6C1B610_9RHOO|nr:cupin domain-containing protein [Nitrogeniibacter mangrovi]QID18873.1 cupin domain-containing protein [Nitrogeniibacter mangrovi]